MNFVKIKNKLVSINHIVEIDVAIKDGEGATLILKMSDGSESSVDYKEEYMNEFNAIMLLLQHR